MATTIDLGNVKGPKGDPGTPGAPGAPGAPGRDGVVPNPLPMSAGGTGVQATTTEELTRKLKMPSMEFLYGKRYYDGDLNTLTTAGEYLVSMNAKDHKPSHTDLVWVLKVYDYGSIANGRKTYKQVLENPRTDGSLSASSGLKFSRSGELYDGETKINWEHWELQTDNSITIVPSFSMAGMTLGVESTRYLPIAKYIGNYAYSSAVFPASNTEFLSLTVDTIGDSAFSSSNIRLIGCQQARVLKNSAFQSCSKLIDAGFGPVEYIGTDCFSFTTSVYSLMFGIANFFSSNGIKTEGKLFDGSSVAEITFADGCFVEQLHADTFKGLLKPCKITLNVKADFDKTGEPWSAPTGSTFTYTPYRPRS